MNRFWLQACILAWLVFLIYEALIGWDKMKNAKPLCPYSAKSYKLWFWYIYGAVLGGFLMVGSILLVEILKLNAGNERIPYFTALNIVSIGSLTTLLCIVFDWGGICVDALG